MLPIKLQDGKNSKYAWPTERYCADPHSHACPLTEAAKNLTPVALELGGETGNWCVVRKDADLKDSARKIAFFKLCNDGYICININ